MNTWRLVVRTVDDKASATYGPGQVDGDGGIVGLPSFDVDRSGNCISLTFDAVSKWNTIKPREIITVERYDAGSASWIPWWKGMVVTVGTERSDEVQRYTALGLKQYFYERVLDAPRWPEQPDLSTDAANLPEFTELNALVYGVTRTAASTPTLGFSIGVALPYRQMMGEFLDQRANQVGSFIVPTGETYVYDGTTFNAGDTVPAVRWGVNADGLFFFRRPAALTISVTENDPAVEVTWTPKSTEGKANAVDFTVIADVDRERLLGVKAQQAYSGPPGYFGGSWVSTERTFVPLSARRPTVNSYPVIERRYQASNPLDLMARNSISFSPNNLWSNISNATDSDPLTFASFGGTFTAITATGGTVTDVGDYRIHTFTSGGTFTVTDAGSNPEVEYLIVAGGGGGGTSNSGAASGGGAGGMQVGTATVTATSYTITVGAGGNGAVFGTPIINAQKGVDSSAFGVTAEGGGRGTQGTDTGKSGGSGSGAARGSNLAGTTAGGAGNAGEGNDGGDASTVASIGIRDAAAGGGGAGGAAPSVAATSSADAAGAGGLGLESTISGSAVTYATGGAGRVVSGGGASGAANTGDGGEGAIGGGNGGDGGSGIVVIRYRVIEPEYTRVPGTIFDFSSPSVLKTASVGGGMGVGAYAISYASDQPFAVAIRRRITFSFSIVTPEGPAGGTITQTSEAFFEYQATNTDTEIRVQQIIVPALSPTGLPGTILTLGVNTLFLYGVNGLRIYDAAFYKLDDDVVTRVAEGLVQDPNSEAAVVDVQGYSPVATEVSIATIDLPSPVVMPVERIEYSITTNDGIVTRYYAGQKFDPELQTEATVLDGVIRRLTGSVEQL